MNNSDEPKRGRGQPRGAHFAALEAGDVKYEGSPCKRCGGTLRYTMTGACIECAVERMAQFRMKGKKDEKE